MTTRPAAGVAGRAAGVLAGAWIGASVWLSLGALALVDSQAVTRVGLLPPWWWLGVLTLAGAAGAVVRPDRLLLPAALLVLLWLPWLPWTVPAAFLLWDGPLEGAVWTAAALSAVWPRGTPRAGRHSDEAPWRSPARAPALAALAAVVLFLSAWAIARPRVPAGDEPHYLVITQSLLGDGDLRIENNHAQGDYLAYYEGVLRPDFMRRGVDRQIYSIHAPGVAVFVLPAFAVAGYPGAVLTIVLAGGLVLALVWRTAYRLTRSPPAAWFGTLAIGTAAPVVLHGFTIYPDPVGAACVMVAVHALVVLSEGAAWSSRSAVVTGAALASLPWLHTRFAVLAAVLGLALAGRIVSRPDRVRLLAWLGAVPALAAAAWFGFFWAIYGTPNPAAPYGARPEGGLDLVPRGLSGLLLDQQFGLAATAPVLLLGLVLVAAFVRRRPRLALELLAVVVPYLATAASYPMWWGGYSAPARFAVAVLPVLALPLADSWAHGGSVRRGVLAVAAALSAAITALLVTVDRGAFIYNGRDGHALLLDWLSPTVDLTLAFPSVHRDGPWAALADTVAWVVAALFVAALAARLHRAGSRPWTRLAAWMAAPALLMIGATVVWAGHAADVLTPAPSQMAWLRRWPPARPAVGLQVPAMRLAGREALIARLELATNPRGGLRAGPQPLLQIPDLPAGEYDVFVEARDRRRDLAGALTVRLGRHDATLETWSLAGRAPGFTGLTLDLPVAAHSIVIAGDAAARDAVQRLVLRPRRLVPASAPPAQRAVRLGRVRVFALDDQAYLEPGAFWVRGERVTRVVLTTDDGRPPTLRLSAGPVPTEVRVAAGAWTRTIALAAEGRADLTVPADALGGEGLTIASSAGFRPSATDDVRWLGVYVTLAE